MHEYSRKGIIDVVHKLPTAMHLCCDFNGIYKDGTQVSSNNTHLFKCKVTKRVRDYKHRVSMCPRVLR